MQNTAGHVDDLQCENERLRARLERFETAIDHIPQALCMYDPDGRVVVCNAAYADVLGLPREVVRPGITGREIVELGVAAGHYAGKSVAEVREDVRARLSPGAKSPVTITRGGRTFCVNHCTTPDGRWVASFQEMTAQLAAESALRASEDRLRLVQEATGLADFESRGDAVSVCSDRFFEQLGLPVGDNTIVVDQWVDLVHPADRERLLAKIERTLADGDSSFGDEFRIIRADNGETRWISCRTTMIRDEAGTPVRTIGAHVDITESKRAEEALRESEERFRLAAGAAGLGVWDYDVAADKREWSGRLREILGISADAEASPEAALACVHQDDHESFAQFLLQARDDGGANRFAATFRIMRVSDGAERWITINGWKTIESKTGAISRILMTVRDVTDEKTSEERIRWSANHDALTRLANRAHFNEKLDEAVAHSGTAGRSIALFMLDLDHFKQINDTLGHDAGDALLRMFAERLRSAVRSGDIVARLGGDEFAIIVPDVKSEGDAPELAKSMLARLLEPFVYKGQVLDCRASIGVSLYPQHAKSAEELMKCADLALYAAKDAGRGVATIFEPRLRMRAERRNLMIRQARGALNDDRLKPHYQPKVDLASGDVAGFEALLRWHDEGGRVRSPASIKAAFDDLDIAAAISDRMIDRVVADMCAWLDHGTQFGHVAVNASAAEFRRDSFAERLLERIHRAQLAPHLLQVEISEAVFLGQGAEYVQRALCALSSQGVKIALDDFGTGFASLRHLKEFPVGIIKIDRSFVRELEADRGDEAIVRAILNLGSSLGIEVVAEGIETQRQADRLVDLGCRLGQGFFFSQAIPASQVPALARALPVRPSSGARGRAAAGLRLVASHT